MLIDPPSSARRMKALLETALVQAEELGLTDVAARLAEALSQVAEAGKVRNGMPSVRGFPGRT